MSNNWRKYIFFIYLLLSIFLCSCNGSKANKQVDDDYSSADKLVSIAVEEKEEYLERIHIPVISSFYMKGVIDEKYTFTIRFTVDSGKVDGAYCYKGKEEWITIKGTIKGDNVRLEETIYNGQKSVYVSNGTYFDGKFDYDNGTIKGTWHSADGTRSLPFKIENYYNTGYPQF
ncbi:hypothetical protein JGH11_14345, partial [Dysgonomonas sp. Marseille-P4677]|uniref:hypothetical protein n=1 Tax=Dysgonomonas sp. Marseille-P4677 TaxID=2364790 RepID=UPI0019123EBA